MKKYWFKNKSWGIGWVPSSPQGWGILIAFILTVIINIYLYSTGSYDKKVTVFIFIISIVALIGVVFVTGEKLNWNQLQSEENFEA